MSVIGKVAPIKERQAKQNSQEWFDGEIADEIKNRGKLFKKFTKSKLQDIYNAARYKVRKMIFNKKRSSWIKNKWVGLPNKISSCEVSAFKINNTIEHDANSRFF